MKIITYPTVIYTFIAVLLLTFSASTAAKKRCKPLLAKLHHIQTMQRKGYSLKRGETLRVKEDKARDKWWQCEHSSLASFKVKYGKINKKSKKQSKKKKLAKNSIHYSQMKIKRSQLVNKVARFNQGSAIVIKAKYQGDKKWAWLQFYQQPIKCQRPKNLNVFAYCSEDKQQQQGVFEQKYNR
ncbi:MULTISPECIES: hypothetical protein [Colwellia]|uniref:Uncharacterized protein n=1 Tax=Colwellia marinimaniae TaxID=1513592 RepID=A0ABQ0MQF2_9GAMM|nr:MULTISPECIES: hypothetical protein [Colwellia]GAW94569.1 hypothetical protein MTCD1_00165 [Colwellia marinimaniae]